MPEQAKRIARDVRDWLAWPARRDIAKHRDALVEMSKLGVSGAAAAEAAAYAASVLQSILAWGE